MKSLSVIPLIVSSSFSLRSLQPKSQWVETNESELAILGEVEVNTRIKVGIHAEEVSSEYEVMIR
jgi:hypothetical protein